MLAAQAAANHRRQLQEKQALLDQVPSMADSSARLFRSRISELQQEVREAHTAAQRWAVDYEVLSDMSDAQEQQLEQQRRRYHRVSWCHRGVMAQGCVRLACCHMPLPLCLTAFVSRCGETYASSQPAAPVCVCVCCCWRQAVCEYKALLVQAKAEGLRPTDALAAADLEDLNTDQDRREAAAAREGFISRHTQLMGALASRGGGSSVMGCAAAALCSIYLWHKADASDIRQVCKALSLLVHPDKKGCTIELQAMRSLLLGLLPAV